MAQTGIVGQNMDAGAAYEQSFGHLKNKTAYQVADVKSILTGKPAFSADLRETINSAFTVGLKAHTTTAGGAGTAGYAMIPIFVDPMVIDVTRKNTPIVEIIPRVTNRGMYADYNKITAKGGAFTRGEDAALSETNTTYDRASTVLKFLYAVGRVTGPSIAAQPSYILMGMQPGSGAVAPFSDQGAPNAKQMEVLVKTREIRELEENLIINGNATTSAITGNPDGTEFDGIVTLQSTTNKVDKNTTAMALGDIDTAIQYAFDDGGRPEVGICASSVFTDLLGLLSSKIGYLQPAVTTQWGFTAINLNTMVGQIPVIPSMYLTNTTGSKAFYFVQLQGNTEMRVLQDLTYEDLAHTNDSQKFMLKIYETLIIRNTAFNSFIGEIA
jgi:hypothetical protein